MFIDLHCDALHRYRWQGGSLSASAGSVDLPRLQAGGALCQCFALFVDTAHTPDAYGEALALARLFRRELAAHPHEICQVTTAAELRQAGERGLIGALLTIEEGAVCRNGAETLREFYELGVRMMTLTWNHKNRFAAPNAAGEPPKAAVSGEGLTRAGLELIDAMNELGVLADVSHLSDAGFWQLAARVKGPFVASHSNARAVCGHPRNLTDDMIRALAKKGGVMGLNFFAPFLRTGAQASCVGDMVRQLRHIRQVGGSGVLALGTDFDGISGRLELADSAALPALAERLSAAGFSGDEVDGFMHKNALRVFEEAL